MNRMFETHTIRKEKTLNGMWRFKAEGNAKEYTLPVPGCWEQHPDFSAYRGRGKYERVIDIEKSSNIRFEFKGVSHTADVYLDGEKLVHHYNAYTPFAAVVKNVAEGRHTLSVEVDNSFNENSALHIPNDYYTYGGITRPASFEYINEAYIAYIHFNCNDNGRADISIKVNNVSDGEFCGQLCVYLLGREMNAEVKIPANGEEIISVSGDFSDAEKWSNENPKLYILRAELNTGDRKIDDLNERVGFRTVCVDGDKIKVNGEEIYFKGFNRHEDYAVVGCAIPEQLMAADLDLMQDMGANAVRTCHYPNDERFLDMCDERGLLVWEENHARGLVLEDMQNKNFEKQCEDCIYEMIENHYNHPSIVIWGILNECASETEEGREMYKKQYEQIKGFDTSRPTTSATCRHFKDISLDLPDVVSFNMYSRWYQDVDPAERNDKEIEWIKKSGGDNKPIIVSELGAAALYGYRDRTRCKWSEERQADILEENLKVYMSDERICGVFIWQFADCRVTEEGTWFQSRARCHNNKGVVDEYRRPKIAYDTVKEIFKNTK